jgi:hypothetical protein
MLGVHVDYLRAAFDAIDAQYGSAFKLGVGPRERTLLKQKLGA